MVRRIFVEKKKGFDVEAQSLCADIRENLGIKGLTGVRVLNRYDMDGLSDELYRKSVFDVFAEPALDTVTEEMCIRDRHWSCVNMNRTGIFSFWETFPTARRNCQ